MNKISLTLTHKELEILLDCVSVTKKQYPLSWSKTDESTLEKIRKAYYETWEVERSKDGEEESRP